MNEVLNQQFIERIGFEIEHQNLLKEAFTHRSSAGITNDPHNERLEFLGDAVLELITTEYLYFHFPNSPEGEMTNYRSALVRKEHLAEVARRLQIGEMIIMSKGEKKSGGDDKDYILANTVESIVGLIYLSKGMETARTFVAQWILVDLPQIIEQGLHIDAKSYFQEVAQAEVGITPHYEVVNSSGKDHEKTFTMAAFVGKTKVGTGKGGSKKESQTAAAEDALKNKESWINSDKNAE